MSRDPFILIRRFFRQAPLPGRPLKHSNRENPTWGQERIANELKLKLGLRVSPRTVGKYLAQSPRRKPDPSQRWQTFVRNHAQGIVACDFFTVVTARFRILYQ